MRRRVLVGIGGMFWLAMAAALLVAGRAWATTTTDSVVPSPPAAQTASSLSAPAREVVKMSVSGVSDDVIRAYIESSSSTFNLSAEDVIHLQGIGVSSTLTTAMLGHDKTLRDQAGQPQPPSAPQAAPYTNPPPQTASDQQVYDNLSPYGHWYYVDDYGWYWQPYGWVTYDYYPWGWLGFGYWWWWPNRGWCWFPHSHFRDFDRLHGFNHFGTFNRFAAAPRVSGFNRFNTGFNRFSGQFRAQTFNRSFSTGGGSFGFHGFTASRPSTGGSWHGSGGWHGGGGWHSSGGWHGGGGFHSGGGGHHR